MAVHHLDIDAEPAEVSVVPGGFVYLLFQIMKTMPRFSQAANQVQDMPCPLDLSRKRIHVIDDKESRHKKDTLPFSLSPQDRCLHARIRR